MLYTIERSSSGKTQRKIHSNAPGKNDSNATNKYARPNNPQRINQKCILAKNKSKMYSQQNK